MNRSCFREKSTVPLLLNYSGPEVSIHPANERNFTMVVGLAITSNTDHATFTITNGNFLLSDTPWTVYHGRLQETGHEYFKMTLTYNTLFLQQPDGDFDTLTFTGLVEVPDGSQYLNYSIDRGGVGQVTLTVATPTHGASNPTVNGNYAIPLTSGAILQQEIELGLMPKPGPK
jgi:hypothetical protein